MPKATRPAVPVAEPRRQAFAGDVRLGRVRVAHFRSPASL